MTLTRAPVPTEQPTPLERAHDRMIDALAAIERGGLDDALEAMGMAKAAVETELSFRRARRGQA
jgi:hypothetical protein